MRAIRSPQILILGLCLLAGLIAFSPNLNSYFISDDFVQIGKVLQGDYRVTWGQEHGGFFRPLFIWSYVVDSSIWSVRPFGYHLTNVVVHSLNAFLVFKLADRLVQSVIAELRTRSVVAAAAGALFLVHPSHSEAVVWISGRADLLATFFVLASLLSFVRYEDRKQKLDLLASLACFAVALLAKESAICTPFLILMIGLSRRTKPRLLFPVFGLFAATLGAFVIIRATSIGSVVGGYGTAQHLNFAPGWIRDRLLDASLRSILPPLTSPWFAFLERPLRSPRFHLINLLVIGGIVAAIWLRRQLHNSEARSRQNRMLITLAALFFMSLAPTINLHLYLNQTLGERFLYLPTVFTCILFAYVASVLIGNRKGFLLALTLVLSFYCWSLYRANTLWGEAASLSHEIVVQLTASASRPSVIVVNAPDNLRGVPVFHNGLPEGVRWFSGGRPIAEVQIVAFQNLQSSSDEVLINISDTLTVRAANPADTFSRLETTECFEVLSPAPDTLNLLSKPCATEIESFFFSSGRIRELRDVGANAK